MEFRNNTTGLVEQYFDIVSEFEKTHSFVKPAGVDLIESWGYKYVHEAVPPSVTAPYEIRERDGIEQKSDKWYQKFKVVTATEDQKKVIDADAARIARNNRDNDLKETDWTACSDVTMTDEMKTYRQALRDLPAASGRPHTHTWPTKPS